MAQFLGKLLPNKPVTIIGAGITGLSMAYYLKQKKIPFQIYEANKSIGGKIGTTALNKAIAEHAANAIYSSKEVEAFLTELNLKTISARPKLKKLIFYKGHFEKVSLSAVEKIKVLLNLLRPMLFLNTKNLTVKEFFKPLLGETLCEKILAPAMTGIYAQHIEVLHFKSLFKTRLIPFTPYLFFFLTLIFNRIKTGHRPKSLSFEHGMQELIDRLNDELKDYTVTDNEVSHCNFENLYIATNATQAASILQERFPSISKKLKEIEYTSLSLATIVTTRPIEGFSHCFGAVFNPKEQKVKILGALCNSEIFDREYPHYSYSLILKGNNWERSQVIAEVQKIITQLKNEDISQFHISPWKQGIPVYNVQRFQTINSLKKDFESIPPGLMIGGNYIDGISIREIISANLQISEAL